MTLLHGSNCRYESTVAREISQSKPLRPNAPVELANIRLSRTDLADLPRSSYHVDPGVFPGCFPCTRSLHPQSAREMT